MADLAYLGVAEASELLRTKKLSPVEFATALIGRIERYDGRINAFLRFTPEIALQDARRAEDEIMRGDWRGPFHGVPYGMKDILDHAGLPTTAHSRILQDNVAKTDAVVTQRLREGGAVFMGKLSLHELAGGGPSFDLPWPPARNPWNRDHFCGSSSSGSAAALAAGFLPAAIGTDTGGSIRNPASMCGVVGIKPTYGLVSRRGVLPLAFSLDHVGAMTRTSRDNALMLDVIADRDGPHVTGERTGASRYTGQIGRGIEGLRIGVIRHFYTRDIQAHAEVTAGIETAIGRLAEMGASISEVTTAPLAEYMAVNRTILMSEAFALHENWMRERPQDYGALARERLMEGAFVRAADYINATRLRRKLADAFHALFADFDVMVTASSMDPACRIDDRQALERSYARQARAPFNVTGSPAMSVPVGFSKSGLPLAMQLVAKPFDEATIYRVADAYERVAGWMDNHPALEEGGVV